MASREVLQLYRHTLRAAGGFADYNFQHYFIRRAREDFRAFDARSRQELVDEAAVKSFLLHGTDHLAMLKRQATITQLFGSSAPATTR
mmetsp:Transcript_4257/g.12053  ORF Transcript_4257/g.12053 Transcript_4257/m.12053 type:complete len:88 (-) Transcript_4257:127-390(-)